MAKLTFTGTTQAVLLALGGDIDANTKVTITDNLYTSANLLAIVAVATTYPVILQKTAAAVNIEDTAAHLLTILAGVNQYTGALKATDANITAAQLNTIAAGTTGKVTATLAPATTIDAAAVTALKDVKATDAITFKTTDTDLVGNADINALISLNKILPKADWSNIASIDGTANDVSVIKQALAIAKNPALAVEITAGIISAADANAIAKLAGGALTAEIQDGTVAATLKALTNVDAGDVLTFASTDKSVKASDLVALNSKISVGDYASIETITADAKDVSYVSAALAIANNADVTITGTITAAQANTIAADVNAGNLTATVEADTAVNLVAKLANIALTDILTLAVNGTTAAAADLNTLATANGGKIKLDATLVTGDVAALTAVYVTNKASFTNFGNENVTITGANPTAAQLNTIAAGTTGKVTAILAPATTIDAAAVTALKDVKATDAITFKTTDPDLDGKDDLNALLAIKKLIPNADFTSIVTIGADAKDVAIVKNVLKDVAANVAVTIDLAGQISAADANAIAKATTGVVTAALKDGSVAATLKALTNVDAGDVLTFKTTDKTVKATDLVDLDDLVTLNADSVTTVTGDAKDSADIKEALTNIIPTANKPEVKISGIIDSADIKDILAATDGKVTAKIKADTAANLAGNLADGIDVNALDVTVNGDTALATNLSTIKNSTSSKVKVDAAEVTGTFAQINAVYVTDKARFTALGNEKVTISNIQSALNVDSIAKATTGVLTADVTGDKANILVSQLKNANAKDDLDITVLTDANGTSAKDLIALTKKTSLIVDASNITVDGIVGNVADINAVIKAESDLKLDLNNAAYTVTGTITASQADAIADATTRIVTATVAADSAAKLVAALADANLTDVLTLKVNGATAAASDLITLNGKTAGKITVDAKEITGTALSVTAVLNTIATEISGQEKAAVKVTDVAAAGDVDAILAKTTGVVTATVAFGTASALNTALVNATAKDKLALEVTGAADAAVLLALDDKTAVKVDASAVTAISGSAADVKKLLASKGVDVSKTAAIALSDLVVKAADVSAVAKATSGVVTAKVEADTAAKLNAALTDKDVNALTLTVNGATATAKDLISLDGKTSVAIVLNVGAITGNIDEITKVFTDTANGFTNEDTTAATISGEITAAQADAVANETSGVVTATIKADSAAVLNTALANATAADALKLTVNGTTADAADLNALDDKTSVTVNAAAIKNIDGAGITGAADVKDAYDANALKTISGLGDETVDLSGATDANASLVKAINDYTTGVITLPTITLNNTAPITFDLKQLGDLNGITKLANIEADNGQIDTINISLKDLLAANDSKNNFTFNLNVDNNDIVNVTNDASGWTQTKNITTEHTYTNAKTGQVVTIVADEAVISA